MPAPITPGADDGGAGHGIRVARGAGRELLLRAFLEEKDADQVAARFGPGEFEKAVAFQRERFRDGPGEAAVATRSAVRTAG